MEKKSKYVRGAYLAVALIFFGVVGSWWFNNVERSASVRSPSTALESTRNRANASSENFQRQPKDSVKIRPEPAPSFGASSQVGVDLKWKSLVAARSIDWAIRQLIISSNI